MHDFIPGRPQDAWSTIRGFKFQIQLTLLRWLDLNDGETLFLECGEDIDRALRSGNPRGVQRELEQVKARSRNLTLRSAEALTAMANFATHLLANPNRSLSFRFTTTAEPGRERLAPFRKGLKGIKIWQALRLKMPWSAEDDQAFSQLRRFLQNCQRPLDCPEDTWAALIAILDEGNPLALADFIRRFEWSCGFSSPEEVEESIMRRLSTLAGSLAAGDPIHRQRYERMLAGLLELLSSPGVKQLTSAARLEILSRPTLTDQDRARLALLEERTSEIQEALRSLNPAQLLPFLFGKGLAELGQISPSIILPSPPPVVSRLARRDVTVLELSQSLLESKWLALHGSIGTGKSHLAQLIGECNEGVLLGIGFRGFSIVNAETALADVLRNPRLPTVLGSQLKGVVFLDDLPGFESRSRLEAMLVKLATYITSTGRLLISTSNRALPHSTKDLIASGLASIEAPAFTDAEAGEIFEAHGVPPSLSTGRLVSTMNATCGGHPMLLTALARYLAEHAHQPEQAFLDALLERGHRKEIDLATARTVADTVESGQCRALLYRLASAGIPLREDEIRTIASIPPSLPEPTICIARLDGLWLRRANNGRFEVSPLAKPLQRELSPDVNGGIHAQLARIIFGRGTLSPLEFTQAIVSLQIAGEREAAAVQMIRGCLGSPRDVNCYVNLGILLFFPPDSDSRLSPACELPLRALQAITAACTDCDPSRYLARIEAALISADPQTAIAAFVAGGILLTWAMEIPTRIAVLGASLTERFRANAASMSNFMASNEIPDGVTLMLPTAQIRTWDELDSYIELLGSLPEDRRNQVAGLKEFREDMQSIVLRPFWGTDGRPKSDAFARLDALEKRCLELGLFELAACTGGGKLVVLGEFENETGQMLQLAERQRSRYAGHPAALDLINARLGQQLFLAGRAEEALGYLRDSLRSREHLVGFERGLRLVDALKIAWNLGLDFDFYADELDRILTDEDFGVPEFTCQLHAQSAVARWRQDRRIEAYNHFERGTSILLSLEDSTQKRHYGAGLLHAITYCASIAETGKPPGELRNGEPFTEGTPDHFTGTNAAMAGMWSTREGPASLHWRLGALAAALGLKEAAATRTDEAMRLAVSANSPGLILFLAPRAISAAMRQAAWADALEGAITYGRARMFLNRRMAEKAEIFGDSVVFDPADLPSGLAAQTQAEGFALWVLSRLISIELGSAMCGPAGLDPRTTLAGAQLIDGEPNAFVVKSAWARISSLLRLCAEAQLTRDQCSRARAGSHEPGEEYAAFAAHALLAFRNETPFEQAASSQAQVLKQLVSESAALIPAERYAEAIIQYWERVIPVSLSQFSAPRQLLADLADAPATPSLLRAKAILKTVHSALCLSVSGEARTWLESAG